MRDAEGDSCATIKVWGTREPPRRTAGSGDRRPGELGGAHSAPGIRAGADAMRGKGRLARGEEGGWYECRRWHRWGHRQADDRSGP